MYRAALLLLPLALAACGAHTTTIEPRSEDRIDLELASPPDDRVMPAPVPFSAEVTPAAEGTFEDEHMHWHSWHNPVGAWGPQYFSTAPSSEQPQVRSNALTNPEGLPGGSRPGLLP